MRKEREVRGVKTKCVLLTAAMTTGISVGAPAASATAVTAPAHSPIRAEPVHEGTNAVCLIVNAATLSPGPRLTPSSSTVKGAGTISCSGTFYGHRVTGPGIFGVKVTLTGTCLMSHARGSFWATIPTDAGSLRLSGPMEASIALVEEVVSAYPRRARLTGVGLGQPLPGNNLVPGLCVPPTTNALTQQFVVVTDRWD